MNEEEAQINYIPIESVEEIKLIKPRKPKPIKKPSVPKKPIPTPIPIQEIPLPQPIPIPIEPKKGFFQNPNELKETLGYDTLNPFLYKFANYLMLPSMVVFVILLIGSIALYLFFPALTWNLYAAVICTIFSLVTFVLIFIITGTSLKRGDLIVIRKFRSGSGTISRLNLRGKSSLLFDKKDPASNVLISWAGAITDPISGCKIIQISEGHPTNDNLNSQVTESEWDKDVSRLTKAKSIADLAEAELFNQGLFGLSWQDLVLVAIALLCLVIIVLLIMVMPDEVAKKTLEGLLNGSLQNSVQVAVQTGLNNAGILTPAKVM
jgi:hypothetical protein